MIATQILAKRGGVLRADLLPNEAPSLSQVSGGPSQLEVVHIHDKEETKFVMNITGTPGRDLFETNLDEMIMTVPLPVSPRIGVTVESENQWANRVAKLFPKWGTTLRGKADPRRGVAPEPTLDVGLFNISLLNGMTGGEPVGVTRLSSFHRGWA